jgi:hypothetical protein
MILYFAGSFSRKPELLVCMAEFEAQGHTCTSRWLKTDHEDDVTSDDELAPGGPAEDFALEDIDDIGSAEGLLFFSSRDHEAKGRGGRHTEFGIALATQKPIFFIGRREQAFHALVPSFWMYDDFEQFIGDLENVQDHIDEFKATWRFGR